jgi:hypothetical protein
MSIRVAVVAIASLRLLKVVMEPQQHISWRGTAL